MQPSIEQGALRLLTYNIHRWAGSDRRLDIERLAGVVRAAGADVVGLNEVLHPVYREGEVEEPLAQLADTLGMHYAFGPSGWVDYGPGWHGPVGNAILSRFPLEDVRNHWLPRLAGTKQRSLLGASLAAGPFQGLGAFVTHLDHAFEGTRLMQVQGIIRQLLHRGPHFLVGDFNTPGFVGRTARRFLPPVLRVLSGAGYQDAFHAVGHGNGRTFPAFSPLFRLDYLFMPARWAAGLCSATTVDDRSITHASDHRPLLVEWQWPDRRLAAVPCMN